MLKFGIVVNPTKKTGQNIADEFSDLIARRGGTAETVRDGYHDTCDILLCVGGDGTMLRAAREAAYSGTPLLGINLGALGYLTEAEAKDADKVLNRLFSGDYQIEKRMMLSVSIGNSNAVTNGTAHRASSYGEKSGHAGNGGEDGRYVVLNELYIGRGDMPHVVRLKLWLNDTLLDVYPGDGILVATPTGSTAYALAAGGPVIDPGLAAIAVVPICSHAVFVKPLLIAPDKELTIVPVSSGDKFSASVSIDGTALPAIGADGIINVRRSELTANIIRFNKDNFYTTLRTKMYEAARKHEDEMSE